MKSLFDYINEARERITNLPFTLDQFKEFIKALDEFEDESQAWKDIEDVIKKQYGDNIWAGFLGWCEGTLYSTSAEEMYKILSNMPTSTIKRVLGSGSYGAAIEAGDRVIKVFHRDRDMERTDREFFQYCMTHDSRVFPRVYKLGKKFVVLEKLQMKTPKCIKYDKWLGPNSHKQKTTACPYTVEQLAQNIVKGNKDQKMNKACVHLPAEAKECLDWAVIALIELEYVCGFTSFSDLRLMNIGERQDGSIIWFDI